MNKLPTKKFKNLIETEIKRILKEDGETDSNNDFNEYVQSDLALYIQACQKEIRDLQKHVNENKNKFNSNDYKFAISNIEAAEDAIQNIISKFDIGF